MNRVPVRSSLRTSCFTRPITNYAKSLKTNRRSANSTLAPLAPLNNTQKPEPRPQTRSSLAVKNWRQNLFPSTSPASRREVELLGEWLNSVLAENLEQHDNPLDVCTNAQHWFSVAFNELVRQVSVDCAERGRLFAVIWKRNQDLLTQLVQVQREERNYILNCHKERMQFLRTDFEFCQSRLDTVTTAYNDEQSRWESSHERDLNKFDSLQQKIDEQIKGRKQLMDELRELKKKLGMPIQEENEEANDDKIFSFDYTEITARAQALRWEMRTTKVDNLELMNTLDDVTHFLDSSARESINLREKFEQFFLSLPNSYSPNIRSIPWILSIISYIYSYYMTYLGSPNADRSFLKQPFNVMVYDMLLGIYGSRLHTEEVLYDLLSSIKNYLDNGMARIYQFARFFGMVDPIPIDAFHFYMYALSTINRAHSGPLFPEVETSGESMISGIPTPAACSAAQKIFERFVSGRSFKFYNERLNKIAGDGMMRFGGKNLAELDQVLDYILTAYVEESSKLDDQIKDHFQKMPDQVISTYSQFHRLMTVLKAKVPAYQLPEMMQEAMIISKGAIEHETFMKIIRKYGLCQLIQFEHTDFLNDQNPDDVIKFMIKDLEFHQPMYEGIVNDLEQKGDEIMLKQIKSSRAKFDQALASRSLGRTFQTIQREFYEKMLLVRLFQSRNANQ